MKRTIVLVVIVGAAMMTIGLTAQQPAPQAGREGGQGRGGGGGFTFPPVSAAEKVAENLYMIPGQGGNTAAFVTANGVVLVDTKLANNGQAILDQVKKVTDKPISHIINTHTHGDHTGSNDFFPASVEIVTQENTAANMKKMPEFQDPAKAQGLPDRTFKDKLTLLRGNESIDLYYFGAAHTSGDAFVVFRNARVVHAGDVFPNKGQPLIDTNNGGSGVAYPRDDSQGGRRDQERGHGDPGARRGDEMAGPGRLWGVQPAVPRACAGIAEGRQDRRAGDDRFQAAGEVQGLQHRRRARRPRRQLQRDLRRAPETIARYRPGADS